MLSLLLSGCFLKKKTVPKEVAIPVSDSSLKEEPSVIFETSETIGDFTTEYLELKYQRPFTEFLYISPRKQKMYWIKNRTVVEIFTISTAEKGIGNEWGSEKTPYGLHIIKEKIGDDVPLYGRLVGRRYINKIATIYHDETRSPTDDVLTRILWLEGLEEGINKGKKVDSYKRHIYIHGTSEEGRLGKPASHGCIRMKNTDIIRLYEKIPVGTPVYIHPK